MGLVNKLILGGAVYGVAREFNKKRDGEQQSRQPAPEPYPPQHSQQHSFYPPPQQQQQAYYSPAPLDNTYQPAHNADYIQPVQPQPTGEQHQQQQQHQPLPPSYDQSKAAPAGQPPQGFTAEQPPATVIPLNMLGSEPQWIDCPFCHQRTKTMINKEGDSMQM